MSANRTILTATPMLYGESQGFFARDAGLLCLALRELGVNSRFVALGEPHVPDEPPLILGRPDQFTDASWWRQWNADAVVLNSWAAPRYEPVARAIKSSGAKLMVRLDSDGCKSPRAGFGHFLGFTYSLARDGHTPLPGLYALAKTLAFRFAPALHDSGMLAHLAHADVIGIESPRAAERLSDFLAQLGRTELAARVRVVPHPVREEFKLNTAAAKQRKIIAVGRWDSHFKNAPLLVESLTLALEAEPDASAVIVGPGEQEVQCRTNKLSQDVRERIRVAGRLGSDALRGELETSQILLVTSRYESFHIAAAEALCCGCSVVGPAHISSMHFFTGHASGTLAPSLDANVFADALSRELAAWRDGARDPAAISRHWRGTVSARAVAERVMELLA